MRLAVVSYAEYLGLDAGEMAKQFNDETGTQPATSPAFGVARRPGKSSLIHDLRSMGRPQDVSGLFRLHQSRLIALGVAILLVLILIAAWLDGGGASDASGASIVAGSVGDNLADRSTSQEHSSTEVATPFEADSPSDAAATLSPGDEAAVGRFPRRRPFEPANRTPGCRRGAVGPEAAKASTLRREPRR